MRAARACARAYRGEDSYFYSRWAIGVQVHRADSRSVDAAPWLQSPADSELSRESRSTVRRAHGRRVRALHVTTPQRRRWVCKHTRLPVSPYTAAVGRRRACASEPVHLRGGACVDDASDAGHSAGAHQSQQAAASCGSVYRPIAAQPSTARCAIYPPRRAHP